MSENRGERDGSGSELDHAGLFRLHAMAYALGTVCLVLLDLAITDGWWSFWPVLAWGSVVFVHYLYVKSTRVDSRWVEERASQVLDKAYDLSHIEDIHQRYDGKKPHERDRQRPED